MYFVYYKDFDLSRTRAGNQPRLSNVNLSTFGRWSVVAEADPSDFGGYTITQDFNAGLQDLIAYGLEALAKAEFVEIQEGEVTNFQRGLAGEIRSVCERFNLMELTTRNNGIIEQVRNISLAVAQQFELTIPVNSIPSTAMCGPSDIRELCAQFVRQAAASQRRAVSRELIENSSIRMARPLVNGGVLNSAPGFLSTQVVASQQQISLLQLEPGSDYTVSVPQIVIDDTPLARRYVRYLQYLAHTYTKLRTRVTVDTRAGSIFMQVTVDYLEDLEDQFELFRPSMPECTIANPSTEQKVILTLAAMGRHFLDVTRRLEIPDELFTEPTLEGFAACMDGNLADSIYIQSNQSGTSLVAHTKSILEAAWSLSKLRQSTLQSTSLNFPELMLFTQPESPEPST